MSTPTCRVCSVWPCHCPPTCWVSSVWPSPPTCWVSSVWPCPLGWGRSCPPRPACSRPPPPGLWSPGGGWSPGRTWLRVRSGWPALCAAGSCPRPPSSTHPPPPACSGSRGTTCRGKTIHQGENYSDNHQREPTATIILYSRVGKEPTWLDVKRKKYYIANHFWDCCCLWKSQCSYVLHTVYILYTGNKKCTLGKGKHLFWFSRGGPRREKW